MRRIEGGAYIEVTKCLLMIQDTHAEPANTAKVVMMVIIVLK